MKEEYLDEGKEYDRNVLMKNEEPSWNNLVYPAQSKVQRRRPGTEEE